MRIICIIKFICIAISEQRCIFQRSESALECKRNRVKE